MPIFHRITATREPIPVAMPAAATPGGKLLTLEAGRFLAALAVLLFHYTGIVEQFRGTTVFGDAFRPGHVGVPYFFVLSGFIIFHVHRGDIGRPDRLREFATRRAVRLYPMFWLISLTMLAGFMIVPALADGRDLGIGAILADLLLLPHANAILPISWTLRHEMVFYALFALAIALGRRGFWLIGAWIVASLAIGAQTGTGDNALGGWSIVAGAINLGFGIGMIVQDLLHRQLPGSGKPWAALGLTTLLILCGIEWWIGHGTPHSISVLGAAGEIGYMIAAGATIYGLVKIENAGWRMPLPGLWQVLGGASYILYLVHQPVGSVMMRLLARYPGLPAPIVFLLTAIVAVAGAIALHLLVERPVLRRLNRIVRPAGTPR